MKKWYARLCHFKEQIKENHLSIYASSITFFILLSLIPGLLLLFSLLPFTNMTAQEVINFITTFLPAELYHIVGKIIEQAYIKSAGRVSLAGFFSLWSSGKGMMALIQSMNRIQEVKEVRGYFRLRWIASVYTLLLLLFVIGGLWLRVFGRAVFHRFFVKNYFCGIVGYYFIQTKVFVVPGTLIFLCLCCYSLLPSRKMKLKSQLPGAVAAVILWSIFSFFFSFYLRGIRKITIYDSFGGLLLFLLWIYFSCFILLSGKLLNQEIKNNKK